MKNTRNTYFPMLHLYYELEKKGKLPYKNGLCTELYQMEGASGKTGPIEREFKDLFEPVGKNRDEYLLGDNSAYWGKDNISNPEYCDEFGPTRQNMLLLFAAYRGEL